MEHPPLKRKIPPVFYSPRNPRFNRQVRQDTLPDDCSLEFPVDDRICGIRKRLDDIEAKYAEREKESAEIKKELARLKKKELDLGIANLIVHFQRKLCKNLGIALPRGSNDPSHSAKFSILAKTITKNQLEKEGLPVKYKDVMPKFDKLISKRNSVAHQSEFELAKLMMEPEFKDTDEMHFYRPAFEYTYGMTYEQAAAQSDETEFLSGFL